MMQVGFVRQVALVRIVILERIFVLVRSTSFISNSQDAHPNVGPMMFQNWRIVSISKIRTYNINEFSGCGRILLTRCLPSCWYLLNRLGSFDIQADLLMIEKKKIESSSFIRSRLSVARISSFRMGGLTSTNHQLASHPSRSWHLLLIEHIITQLTTS